MIEFLNNIDTQLFLFLNGINSPFWDKAMWWVSAKQTWYPFYIILMAIIVQKTRWLSIPVILSIILLIVLADQSSVHLFKNVFERLRPTHNPELEGMIHTVRGYRGGAFGFVSSHAANSFALAVFLAYFFKNKIFTLSVLIWALIVSYSRIYLGVHYPGDVLAGAALGALLAWGVYRFYNSIIVVFIKRENNK